MTRYRRRSELWLAALRRLVLPSDHTMTTNLLNLTHTTSVVTIWTNFTRFLN